MRHAARRDNNEPELIALARGIGAMCINIQQPVDWLIGWRGCWYPCEIKTETGKYREGQILFLAAATERQLPAWTWRTEADVLASLGARRGA